MIYYYSKIPIIPVKELSEFSSWEDMIKDPTSPLYGYIEDFKNMGLRNLLNKIFIEDVYVDNNTNQSLKNFYFVVEIYRNYLINLLPEDIEDNKSKREELLNDLNKLSNITINAIDVFIKYGIIDVFYINIPYDKLTKAQLILGEGMYIPESNVSLYAKNIEDTTNRIDYKPSSVDGIYGDLSLAMRICIFSKTKEKLYDITNYVDSTTISVTETGGNFKIQLLFVSDESLEDSVVSESWLAHDKICNNEDISKDNSLKLLYFQSIFRENDLVFIKFENLELEQNKKKVSELFWDMIGLIDVVQLHSESSNAVINIIGRDLIKLFIEDSNNFYPFQFSKGAPHFGGYSSKLIKRLFIDGLYVSELTKIRISLQSAMGMVLTQLSNVQILTDECNQWLLNEYGKDNLSKEYVYNQAKGELEISGTNPAKGIFGIINFAVDERINHYRIVDTSIFSSESSLLTYFTKIAQYPLVELIFDTFGAKYNIFARRPPFDLKGITNSVIINVDPVLSISEDLYMDTEVYSVFSYEAKGTIAGNHKNIPFGYLPFIVLDEYGKIWGNRLYKAISNYTNVDEFSEHLKDEGSVRKSTKYTMIKDLIWIIQIMAYLPFTRKGQIVLRGDRRIKRGSWIRYKKTGELFYVNEVSNSAQITNAGIERLTTLSVSRGMLEEDIKGKVSYFNLIKLDTLEEDLIKFFINPIDSKYITTKENENSNLISYGGSGYVNKGVFDYFIKGEQFERNPSKKMQNKHYIETILQK